MSGRILIADADPEVRAGLVRHLGATWETACVGTGDEALERLASFDPAVVIAGDELPGANPRTIVAALDGNGTGPSLIVVGRGRSMRRAITAIDAGAYDYLPVPVDPDALDRTLDRCIRDRRAATGADGEGPVAEPDPLVGSSRSMLAIYKRIARVADSSAPVLVRGETGTGKELVARTIHGHSSRSDQPFAAVNCTAMPDALLESELFGHVKGAFTGAVAGRRGRIAAAGRGTLFLDEIGDTSPVFQAKLLRVLQDGEYHPVGSDTTRRSEARVLAATHRDVEELVRKGDFREDLYFRLRVVEIFVPPLRERPDDIPRLARHFLAVAARRTGKAVRVVPPEVMRRLKEHDWPGNVRELENAILRATVLARGAALHVDDLGLDGAGGPDDGRTLAVLSMDEAERERVTDVLDRTCGNKRMAARVLRIGRGRLNRLIEKHEIDVAGFAEDAAS